MTEDNQHETKVETASGVPDSERASSADSASENMADDILSMESLDELIAADDPTFFESLSQIGPISSSETIYEGDVELEFTLEGEKAQWQRKSFFIKILAKILPLPYLSFKIKSSKAAFRLFRMNFRTHLKEFIHNLGPTLKKFFKEKLGSIKAGVGAFASQLGSFSLVKKLALLGLLVAAGFTGVFIYKVSTKKWTIPTENLFMSSLEEWAQKSYTYDPKANRESLYESMRASQNILLMEKMVVNLKPSESSGPNPMGAFEFYVEGTSVEAIIEIKDRESEMRDLFQRNIEDMTFDDVASGEGKQLLNEKLRKELNKVLTTGKIRRIFIKTAIVKP